MENSGGSELGSNVTLEVQMTRARDCGYLWVILRVPTKPFFRRGVATQAIQARQVPLWDQEARQVLL
jgi:hypothetical protein